MNTRKTAIRNQRGVGFAYTGIAIIAFVSFAALAVDTAHLALTANEVQIAADAAATSGAISLLNSPLISNGNQAARDGANLTLRENMVDTKQAIDYDVRVFVGSHPTGECKVNPGGTGGTLTGLNAVTAEVTAEVPNLMGGIFRTPTTTVTRRAKAAFQPSLPEPTLNVTICEKEFNQNCFRQECLPSAELHIQSPSTAWTAFTPFQTATPDLIAQFLQDQCDGHEGNRYPINTPIKLNNKLSQDQMEDILRGVECLVADGLGTKRFTAPVVTCPQGKIAEGHEVVGYMTVIIDRITPDGIDIHPVFDIQQPGPDGGCNFSTGYVKLVE